jgi:hypothetical protein
MRQEDLDVDVDGEGGAGRVVLLPARGGVSLVMVKKLASPLTTKGSLPFKARLSTCGHVLAHRG